MVRSAEVNYHVHKNEQQAFELDAGGIPGNLIWPEIAPTEIDVADSRDLSVSVSFAADAVEFVRYHSQISDFDDARDFEASYDSELTQLLTDRFGAKEVVVFDHTVRVDDPNATRKPARNVHSVNRHPILTPDRRAKLTPWC